jgi:hypothetical protein
MRRAFTLTKIHLWHQEIAAMTLIWLHLQTLNSGDDCSNPEFDPDSEIVDDVDEFDPPLFI